jgi:hypothetical protein
MVYLLESLFDPRHPIHEGAFVDLVQGFGFRVKG